MFQIRRNRRNLPAGQHTAATTQVLDEATRSMLAMFITHLLLVLPVSIYYNLPLDVAYRDLFVVITMQMICSSNLFIEPTVFVYFNKQHRRRALQAVGFCRCPSCSQDVEPTITPEVFQLSYLRAVANQI